MKRLSIWGVTGSIGTQTLDFIDLNPNKFELITLTAHSQVESLYQIASKYQPKYVVVTDESCDNEWKSRFEKLGCHFDIGRTALLGRAGAAEEDQIVNALVGGVGLEATMLAIEAGVDIALANKEVLVMAGELVMAKASENEVTLLPIDSEHSAIFQCLEGETVRNLRRIILTASGGPFLNRSKEEMQHVAIEDALNHPNWSMGRKITIDSATLANKGLELIEARWLFGVPASQIDVVIHPQSIIHSMVEFRDGSIKAQLGHPDMRVPIAYTLTYPERWETPYGSLDLSQLYDLKFMPPDLEQFPALKLAYEALKLGGNAPAVFNGADEVAVAAFLNGQIDFYQIPMLIEEALNRFDYIKAYDLESILQTDARIRKLVTKELIPAKI